MRLENRAIRAVVLAALGAFALVTAVAVGLWVWMARSGLEAAELMLARAAPWLLCWRLLLFVALMVYWRELVRGLSTYAGLSDAATAALRRWRVRAGIGLIVMDLVLVEDAIGFLRRTVL